jgi:hypothetical protein
MNAGVRPLRLSSRKKDSSRNMILQLISQDRLVIHPECRKLRKELLSYSCKDTVDEKPMRPDDGGDNLVDSLHYMVELNQYQLFLEPRHDEDKSREEKLRLHKIEVENMRKIQYPLKRDEDSSPFEIAGSPAGYL